MRHNIYKTDILLEHVMEEGSETLAGYQKHGGYKTLEKVLKDIEPQAVIDEVRESGLRGRGGAGFPTGVKWGFLPKGIDKPVYLLVNSDESEPGTFKDRVICELDPHRLIEGSIISAYAIGAKKIYLYIRGEFFFQAAAIERALDEAREAGFLGKNIKGSGFDCEMYVHRGAGAYVCGEETALIESIEGKRGFPRLKPPFPAVVGIFGSPTIVNNVETLANVPAIVEKGAAWYKGFGTEKSPGTRIVGVSGHVKRPGIYELPMGIPLMDVIEKHCGGIRSGHQLKAVIPGGSSVPVLTAAEIKEKNVCLDYESMAAAGTMLGSAGAIVMDETTCMVSAAYNESRFYAHESCGQCTPCREGTWWMAGILKRIHKGEGKMSDIDLLTDICDNMSFKTICPLADAAAMPISTYVKKFRHEFEYYIEHGRSMVTTDLSIKVPEHA